MYISSSTPIPAELGASAPVTFNISGDLIVFPSLVGPPSLQIPVSGTGQAVATFTSNADGTLTGHSTVYTVSGTTTLPEPATWILVAIQLGLAAFRRYRAS